MDVSDAWQDWTWRLAPCCVTCMIRCPRTRKEGALGCEAAHGLQTDTVIGVHTDRHAVAEQNEWCQALFGCRIRNKGFNIELTFPPELSETASRRTWQSVVSLHRTSRVHVLRPGYGVCPYEWSSSIGEGIIRPGWISACNHAHGTDCQG
jgi:hypothetical protein